MTKLAFLDTETTGLHRGHHEMWELAYIIIDTERYTWEDQLKFLDKESELPPWAKCWQFSVDLTQADEIALNIGGFYQRGRIKATDNEALYVKSINPETWEPQSYQFQSPSSAAREIWSDLQGAHLVCAVPDFDAHFVGKFLDEHGFNCPWHYHLVCVENLLAGKLGIQPPWKSEDLYKLLDLQRDYPGKHTALGDVIQNINVYRKVMGV